MLASSSVVCLAGCILCRAHRQRRDEHGAGSLCCECTVLLGSGEAGAHETQGQSLAVRASRRTEPRARPNLPSQQIQISTGSDMDDLDMDIDSDIAARLRRWQVRALEHEVEAGRSVESDFTPRTAQILQERREERARDVTLTPEELFRTNNEAIEIVRT